MKVTEEIFQDAKKKLCQDQLKEKTKSGPYEIKCPVPTVGAATNCRWIYGQNNCACGPALCHLNVKRKSPADDNINHPSYYTDGQIEVSDFIADKNLNFFRGNVVKYVARAGKKNADAIDREIERFGGK